MNTRSIRFLGNVATLAILALALASCTQSKKVSGKKYEDYPVFEERGAMTLTLAGQPYTVKIEATDYNNTDDGYPDSIEITGDDTYIIVEYAKKDLDFDSETPYTPILSIPLPVNPEDPDEDVTLALPELGTFAVTGGTLTLQKAQKGRDGRDWWDALITLNLETADGPQVASGSFSGCIIPVW